MAQRRASLVANPYVWAVAIRLLLFWLVPRALQGDAADYELIANNIAAGRGFSRCYEQPFTLTAQRPPLYPLVLGGAYFLGLSHDWGPVLLNILFDLASMWLARRWGSDLKLAWAPKIPWVIGLCPLLITYAMYPTTENMSIMFFFAALVATFRRRAGAAGLLWGLLALCRSYYLLFPFLFLLFPPSQRWKRGAVAAMIAVSLIPPSIWVARNYRAFGGFVFSQSGMVGWQMYQGFCVPGFDWWKEDHLSVILSNPTLKRMLASHCSDEKQIYAWDSDVKRMVGDFVVANPGQALRNFAVKTVNLFTNWGLIMPYNRVPFVLVQLINAVLFLYWFRVLQILRGRKRGSPGLEDALRFSWLNIGYVVLVTAPFAVDARYLLAPFLTLMIGVFEIVKTPRAFLEIR